jgi:YHS domain-containing protein
MKNSPVLLILSALAAHAAGGTPSQMTLDRANASLHAYYPGARVWQEQLQQKVSVDRDGVILKGYDVVAYFMQHKAIEGAAKYQTTYQGAKYYFSSARDLAIFKRNPAKYVPQYGGFCANHVRQKQLVDSDPKVFFIINEKLYLCSSPGSEKEFRSHEEKNINKADKIWNARVHPGQPYNQGWWRDP